MISITFIPNQSQEKEFLVEVSKICKSMLYLANKKEVNWDKCKVSKNLQIYISHWASNWIREIQMDDEEITQMWSEVQNIFFNCYLKEKCNIKMLHSILFARMIFIGLLNGKADKDKLNKNMPIFEVKMNKESKVIDLKNFPDDGVTDVFGELNEFPGLDVKD